MPTPLVESASTLTAGIRANFAETYKAAYEGIERKLAPMVDFVPSDKLTEIYAYYESAPHPRRWPRGEPATHEAFASKQFSITNKDWVGGVGWNRNDLDDDLTRSLMARARDTGLHFALLHERVIFQQLLGTTDATLLDVLPNAPDGTALFSGSARFGAPSGNIVSGSGVATSAAVTADLFSAVARVMSFQDTKGQPLWNPTIADQTVHVIFGAANLAVFTGAFAGERTLQKITGTSTSDTSVAAAISNLILARGFSFNLVATPRITDNDWFVYLEGGNVKPFIIQTRQGLREYVATMENNPQSAQTKEEFVQWDARFGYGLNLPYTLIKIDN
jgi:phage major head subunit gpT-like protein